MEVFISEDYDRMSEQSAQYLYERIRKQPKINVGLATGGTPLGMYDRLIQRHQQQPLPLDDVRTFNLDEYVGLSADSPQSYHYYMKHQLFSPLGINLKQTHLPDGVAPDIQVECKQYEQLIEEHGGIDVQLLGVGQNGHIAFNEPGTDLDQRTHEVQLAPSTRKANARFFEKEEDVPQTAITMGIATILEAKEIIVLASGEAKAEAIYHLLETDEVTEEWPVTALKKHSNVKVFIDEGAASLLTSTDGLKVT